MGKVSLIVEKDHHVSRKSGILIMAIMPNEFRYVLLESRGCKCC